MLFLCKDLIIWKIDLRDGAGPNGMKRAVKGAMPAIPRFLIAEYAGMAPFIFCVPWSWMLRGLVLLSHINLSSTEDRLGDIINTSFVYLCELSICII